MAMAADALFLVSAIALVSAGVEARRPVSAATQCGAAQVSISVSPLVRSKELRVLELSWNFEGARPGDRVSLYDYDPVERRQWDDQRLRNEPLTDASSGGLRGGLLGGRGGPDANVSPGGAAPGFGQGLGPGAGGSPGSSFGAPAPSAPGPGPFGGQYGPFGQPGPPPPAYYGAYDPRDPANRGYSSPSPSPYPYQSGYAPGASSPFPPSFGGRARRQHPPPDEEEERMQQDAKEAAQGPPLASVPTDGLRSGWRPTSVQEKHVPSAHLGYRPRCLNYWAVYERPAVPPSNQSEVLAVTCLRTRPTWMSDFRAEIGRLRLTELFIPGTHDSASIQEEGRNSIVDRYSVTQDESILGQLIYGVRYIDLRVGFYPNKEVQWWANHGVVRMQPLLGVLHDIKAFLANTNEIVILDVQNFPAGFGKDNMVHMKLVHLLSKELGELMAPRDNTAVWRSTLEEVWSRGRRLIVAYDKDDVLPWSSRLWPAVRQFWGDVQTPDQLSQYATSVLSQQFLRGSAWALMAELTPNARLIATNPTGSLRRLAHLVNRNVTAWAEGPLGENINTLAVDFVRSTGVVEAALWHNLRRAGVDVCSAHRLLGSV